VRFCWISVGPSGWAIQATAPVHRRYRPCFQAFYEYSSCPTWLPFLVHNSLNGWLLGAPGTTAAFFVCKDHGSLHILGLEIALVNVPRPTVLGICWDDMNLIPLSNSFMMQGSL